MAGRSEPHARKVLMHDQKLKQNDAKGSAALPGLLWMTAVCDMQKGTVGVRASFHLEQGFIQMEETALSWHMVPSAYRPGKLTCSERVTFSNSLKDIQ